MKPKDTPTPHEAGYKEGHRLGFSFGQDVYGTYEDYLLDKKIKELETELRIGDIDEYYFGIPPFNRFFK